jgi:hypothetical protein
VATSPDHGDRQPHGLHQPDGRSGHDAGVARQGSQRRGAVAAEGKAATEAIAQRLDPTVPADVPRDRAGGLDDPPPALADDPREIRLLDDLERRVGEQVAPDREVVTGETGGGRGEKHRRPREKGGVLEEDDRPVERGAAHRGDDGTGGREDIAGRKRTSPGAPPAGRGEAGILGEDDDLTARAIETEASQAGDRRARRSGDPCDVVGQSRRDRNAVARGDDEDLDGRFLVRIRERVERARHRAGRVGGRDHHAQERVAVRRVIHSTLSRLRPGPRR